MAPQHDEDDAPELGLAEPSLPTTLNAHEKDAAGDAVTAAGDGAVRRRKLGQKFTMAEVAKHNTATDCWLVVDNKVYDVTKFVNYHPGGQVISTWAGRDATDPFYAFHEKWIRTKIDHYYIGDVRDYVVSPVNADFRKLFREVEDSDLMKTSMSYYVAKIAMVFGLFVLAWYLALAYDSFEMHVLSAVVLFWFWHQCSFLGHDGLHNVIFRSQKAGHLFSLLFSNLGNGISAAWWKYTHNQHHMVPNEYERDPDIMHLPIFAMTHRALEKAGLNWFGRQLIAHQHLTFIPIMAVARVNLYVQTFYLLLFGKVEKMPWQRWNMGSTLYWAEVISVAIFWTWYGTLLMMLPAGHRIMYFCVTNLLMGLLHLQISLNHWAMDKFQKDENYDELLEFSKTQILTSRNINANWMTHWFFGGLEFQAEHHLFPRMPRHSYGAVKPLVMAFAKRHNITYSSAGFWAALFDVIRNFAEVASQV